MGTFTSLPPRIEGEIRDVAANIHAVTTSDSIDVEEKLCRLRALKDELETLILQASFAYVELAV